MIDGSPLVSRGTSADSHKTTAQPGLQSTDSIRSVRVALNRAKAAARLHGLRPAQSGGGRRAEASNAVRSKPFSGGRDPLLVGGLVDKQLDELGWHADLAVGGVIGRWAQVVGDEVAAHCVPETFEERTLTVRADSATWATQMQLLIPVLLRRLDEEVGAGVVERVHVVGPGTRRRFGPRSVASRKA